MPDLDLSRIEIEIGKPLTVDSESRKRLDHEYEQRGLDTIEERIAYLRNQTGLLFTVHEERHSKETILYSLECTYINDGKKRGN